MLMVFKWFKKYEEVYDRVENKEENRVLMLLSIFHLAASNNFELKIATNKNSVLFIKKHVALLLLE